MRESIARITRATGATIAGLAREPGPGALGALGALAVLAWTGALVWLAPSNGWDGQLYLEPIVYYAIQNGGFEWVETVSSPAIVQANTAPKGAMYLALFAVMYEGRALVEWSTHLHLVTMVLAFVSIGERFGIARARAIAWACALLLTPVFAFQLRSTYVDADFGAIFLVACAFLVVKEMRIVDALLGAMVLGILGATKHTGLVVVPLLALGFSARLLAGHLRSGRRWGVLVACTAIVLGFQLPIYLRTWSVTGNPIYPRRMTIGPVVLEGPYDALKSRATGKGTVFEMGRLDKQFYDTRDNGYGVVAPFVVFPLATLALAWLLARAVFWRDRRAWILLAALLPAFIALALSPSKTWGRYNVAAVAAAFLIVAWWLESRAKPLSHAVAGALIVGNLLLIHWSSPLWCVDTKTALELVGKTPSERAVSKIFASTHLVGAPGELREETIGPGDVVANTFARFPSRMWNEDVSNQVVRVVFETPKEYLERLDEVEAQWVFVKARSRADRALSKDARWVKVPDSPKLTSTERIWRRADSGSSE